jgi:hypothetical protein
MTLLEQLIEEFPNKPWNWIKLCFNSSISFDFIKSHPNLPWVPKMVTLNPNVNDEVIKNMPLRLLYCSWKQITDKDS